MYCSDTGKCHAAISREKKKGTYRACSFPIFFPVKLQHDNYEHRCSKSFEPENYYEFLRNCFFYIRGHKPQFLLTGSKYKC